MKKLLIGLLALTSLAAFSQERGGNINVGRGEWICSAEGIKSYPTVARGRTKLEAKHYAIEACADYEGSSFHCDVEECMKDTNRNNSNINIDFRVERRGSSVTINLSNGTADYMCTSEAFRNSYIAKAPTKLEAQVLARQTCVADGNHGMHCDVEECESLSNSRTSGRRGGITLGGGIRIGNGRIRLGN